ncbi:MAG: Na+/H+ antiporter NhaC family protein [Bacillota bacterium]|nr:Na+/H+ antiporter NhaC family protein [Bacillota bacterium]
MSAAVPAILVLFLVLLTGRLLPALVVGLAAGGVLRAGAFWPGLLQAAGCAVRTLAQRQNLYVCLLLLALGALSELMRLSGGVEGLGRLAGRWVRSEGHLLCALWLLTPLTFVDSAFHIAVCGLILRPLAESIRAPRERLAYLLNATSAPLIALLPLGNTYAGYMAGLLAGEAGPARLALPAGLLFLSSLRYAFFSWAVVALAALVTAKAGLLAGRGSESEAGRPAGGAPRTGWRWLRPWSRLRPGRRRPAPRVRRLAEAVRAGEAAAPARPLNLFLPLGAMVAFSFALLWWSGRGEGLGLAEILQRADVPWAMAWAGLLTLGGAFAFYLLQGLRGGPLLRGALRGAGEMFPPMLVLLLAWSLARLSLDLGLGELVTGVLGRWLPTFCLPVALFLAGAAVSFLIGTSWGTWALLLPVALALPEAGAVGLPVIVGAVFSGGMVGEHASPVADTPLLSAAVLDLPLAAHLRHQAPYAAAAFGLAALAHLAVGVWG